MNVTLDSLQHLARRYADLDAGDPLRRLVAEQHPAIARAAARAEARLLARELAQAGIAPGGVRGLVCGHLRCSERTFFRWTASR